MSMASLIRICVIAFFIWPSTAIFRFPEDSVFDDPDLFKDQKVNRSDFPIDFKFGVSTSAVQIEGASREGGKGASIWDYFFRNYPEKIVDGSNGDVAVDSYHRYKEDIKAMKEIGVHTYRFSISWTRILPTGSLRDGVNQEGIDHYNNFINELLRNGIEPFVTLFHFDSPQVLQDKYGGFLSRKIVDDFRDYSEICFKAFGDRVKYWITVNEPVIIAKFGYDMGFVAPGRCSTPPGACRNGDSSTEPYIVSHNLLLAHATAARLYKEKFRATQEGEIGISLVFQWCMPYTQSRRDKEAAKRAMDFGFGWYMDPLVYGDYPLSMKSIVRDRLPTFTNEEKQMVKGSFDFIGINYYTSRYIKDIPAQPLELPISYTVDSHVDLRVEKNGIPIGEKAEGSPFIYIYPRGLENSLLYVMAKYKNPKIYVTENGVCEKRVDSIGLAGALQDQHRITFILRHLYRLREAMKAGANVKGYMIWSLLDGMEFGDGFTLRFGLYYVDYKDNLKRYPKDSARWLRSFLKNEVP